MKALIILARIPKLGVKTRLAKSLGKKSAVEIYKKCLNLVLREVNKLDSNITIFLHYRGKTSNSNLKKWFDKRYILIPTKSENNEENLKVAFDSAFEKGAKKVVCIATDVPNLSSEIISKAFEALDKKDVVIGPDHSGGFYLFGIKNFYPQLFTYKYKDKSKMVLEEIERIKDLGLTYFLLPQLVDIDTVEDLKLFKDF